MRDPSSGLTSNTYDVTFCEKCGFPLGLRAVRKADFAKLNSARELRISVVGRETKEIFYSSMVCDKQRKERCGFLPLMGQKAGGMSVSKTDRSNLRCPARE